jgi:MFS transporter, FHS family, glucose/mannose:H+ symporter
MKYPVVSFIGVVLSFATLAVFAIGDNIRGPIYPDILQLYSVSPGSGSLYFLITSMAAIMTQWAFPSLLKKTQGFYVLYLFFLAIFAGSCWLQWLALVKLHWTLLLISASLFGIGLGGTSVVHGILLKNSVYPKQQSRAFSLLHAIYGAASLASPFMVSYARHSSFEWVGALLLTGGLSLLLFLFLLASWSRLPVFAEPRPTQLSAAKAGQLSSDSFFLFLALSLSLIVALEIMISTRLVLFLREVRQMDPPAAESMLSLFFLFLLLGRLAVGAFGVPRITFDRLALILVGLMIVTCFVGFAGYDLAFCVLGLWIGPLFPLTLAELSHKRSDQFTQASSYLYVGVGLGILLMHALFGLVAKYYGIHSAMYLSLGFPLLAGFFYWRLSINSLVDK